MPDSDQIAKLDAMPRDKQAAFLALFAGAWLAFPIFISPEGHKQRPGFGKHECEQIDDWEDFYTRELPALGWIKFVTTGEPMPALGGRPGETYINAAIKITEDGWKVREEYWRRVNKGARDA